MSEGEDLQYVIYREQELDFTPDLVMSTSQIRRSKLESIIHCLSFRFSQAELAGVSPLLKDPFFHELFSQRSFEFRKVTDMSRYSAEDALAEVYDA